MRKKKKLPIKKSKGKGNQTKPALNSKRGNPLKRLKSVKPDNIEALKADYSNKALDKIPDKFVLYRIIGNDLYPRHKKGQSRENVQFVLKNEPKLKNCEKRWIVNRIIDKEEEHAIIDLLCQHNQSFIQLPFLKEEYKLIGWDTECLPTLDFLISEKFESLDPGKRDRLITAIYRLKNNYVMNNNGARNIALRDGKSRAKWVLPWDGNCFVTPAAWRQICADVTASPYLKYFAVPMTRVEKNKQLLSNEFIPNLISEPQLIFRTDSVEEFNEEFCYGCRPKVELFWRLGIPGKWDGCKDGPWDQVRRPKSVEARQFGVAGWTARMSSGMKKLEKDDKKSLILRGESRNEAIISTIRNLDVMVSGQYAGSNKLSFFRAGVLRKEKKRYQSGEHLPPIVQLIADAEKALTRGQRVFDDSITLALAWYFTDKKKYAKHGAHILERFFVNPATRMTPHLKFAQVRMGRNNNKGLSHGIIEMKDMYYYLDAVRLLMSAGVVTKNSLCRFKEWLSMYLEWLLQSPQGKKERRAINNHGTYYDLQVAAIADFLEERSLLFETLVRGQSRIPLQFAPDGSQPEELKRTIAAHYCCFNLQGWIYLAEIASRWGIDFWSYKSSGGASLIKGAKWLLSHAGKDWPYRQIDKFDTDRYLPIWFAIPQNSIKLKVSSIFPKSRYLVKPRFFPHDGVRPYWNLG